MQIVIITGMSGAGKTVALKTMEDLGYYSVDNMPVVLLPKFAEILDSSASYNKVAIGVDIRSADNADQLKELKVIIEDLKEKSENCTVLFLDASDKVLLKRFKETRRAHPLSQTGRIEDGIKKEREYLAWLKERSDYVIDTSGMTTRKLRNQMEMIFLVDKQYQHLYLNILSFGYKYGIPEDADLVLDMRFLPNPFYVDELKTKTGLDQEVRDYVLQEKDSAIFLEKLLGLLDYLIPKYIEEGKNQLVIAFGCTGGKHRSVTIAETVYAHLKESANYGLGIEHRDIKR